MYTYPVDYQDYESDEHEMADMLADNIIPELSEMDVAGMEEDKSLLEVAGFDLEIAGFENKKEKINIDNVDNIEDHEDQSIYEYREDVIFDADNWYGIPSLLDHMLCETPPTDVWCNKKECHNKSLMLWGSDALPDNCNNSFLGFYVDDRRFDSIWFDAVKNLKKIISLNFTAVIEPDFSVWRDEPRALQIYNRYRSQWIARYYQEAGIKIIPSLSWSDDESHKFCLCGIPENVKLVSVQCRTSVDSTGKKLFERGIKNQLEKINPESIMIYGGECHRDWLKPIIEPMVDNVFYLSDFMKEKRKK
jgi:hypothetical protein